MEQNVIAERILRHLDVVVLKRIARERYELCGQPPAFYDDLFPATGQGSCLTPWRHSHMLEFFFQSAEDYFLAGKPGQLSSGTWEEENLCEVNQALCADAMIFEDAQIVTIRLLRDAYTEKLALLRKAREELLERRLLTNDLEKYKIRARVDGLTKVYNRMAFMEMLASYMTQPGIALSLIMLDIDHFKRINDTYGHQSGDLVLSDLGEILLSRLRRDDVVARYGGEEFIILIPLISPAQVANDAEKLRKSVAEHAFGSLLPVTISLGCSVYNPGESMEEFIRRADMSLYAAKEAGRNAVRMWLPGATGPTGPEGWRANRACGPADAGISPAGAWAPAALP
jgi:diguanylate cyclase (GGDEF)-like protein